MAPEAWWQAVLTDVDDRTAVQTRPIVTGSRPTFYQPDPKGPIYKMIDGEAPLLWLNWWYVEGRYYSSVSALETAKRRMLERDHALALIEDAQRAGHVHASDPLIAALEASFALTEKGRQAIAAKVA